PGDDAVRLDGKSAALCGEALPQSPGGTAFGGPGDIVLGPRRIDGVDREMQRARCAEEQLQIPLAGREALADEHDDRPISLQRAEANRDVVQLVDDDPAARGGDGRGIASRGLLLERRAGLVLSLATGEAGDDAVE